jgi:hypothetical protein
MTEGTYSNVGHRGPVFKGLGAMNPCDLSMGRSMLLAPFWTCLAYNRTGCPQGVGNEMCSNFTCSFHLSLCRVLLFVPQNMFYICIHLLNWLKFVLFPVIFILNIFQSYAAVCIRCLSPRLRTINIHRRGNIVTVNSKRRHSFWVRSSRREERLFVSSGLFGFHHV